MAHSTVTDRRQTLWLARVFQSLSRDEFLSLEALSTVHAYDAGDIVIEDGEAGEDVFVVSTGAAVVCKNGINLSYLRQGDVVGEMALITGQPRSATVIMAERGEVLRLPRDVYADLVERHPEMWRDLCQLIAARLRETTGIGAIQAATMRLAA